MAAQYGQNYSINASMEQIINILRSPGFSAPLNITLKSENPSPTGVWFRFHHGMSWVSYGEKITITLTPLSATNVLVQIHSECGMPTQVIDWGKNRSVVNNIYNQLMIALASTVPGFNNAPAPSVAQPAPQPAAQPAGFKFCFKCGNKLDKSAMFCNVCGQKQE